MTRGSSTLTDLPLNKPLVKLIAQADTKIGELQLLHRTPRADPNAPFHELLVDGRTLMSSYNDVSERALAARSIERHGGDQLRVLVGGLGLGHTAHEALRSDRVAAVDVIEFVPEVIEWFEDDVLPLAPDLRADSRLEVIFDDVYTRLAKGPTETYDLLLVDVDHAPDDPLSAQSEAAMFYSEEGLRRVAAHLRPGGMLGVWSCADNVSFEETLCEVFTEVLNDTTLFVDDLFGEEDETNWLFFASGVR